MTGLEEDFSFESSTLMEKELTLSPLKRTFTNFHITNVIRSVAGFVILILNIAVIYCTIKWTGLKKGTRIMFLNLSASDVLSGIASIYSFLLIPESNGLVTICWILYTFAMTARCACSAGIMLLAFDIFANTILFKASNITPWFLTLRFVGSVTGISWVLLSILGTWIAVDTRSVGCDPMTLFYTMSGKVAMLSTVVQSFISIVFYTMTFSMAYHKIRKLKASVNPENLFQTAQTVKRLQREMKIAKIALALGVLYIVSYGPNIVMITAVVFFEASVPLHIVSYTGILVNINSLGNCVIYWWRSQEFRQIWGKLLSCNCNNSVNPN